MNCPKRLDLRNTPELVFIHDGGMEHGAKIAQILKDIDKGTEE